MRRSSDFAILAPVPGEYLRDGRLIADALGYVAFGSAKWELFRDVDARREGRPVPVLIYPSHENEPAAPTFLVRWAGLYVGHVESVLGGLHPDGGRFRPPRTETERWPVYWHIRGLHELPRDQWLAIAGLQRLTGSWRKNGAPRGPELVQVPPALASGARSRPGSRLRPV